MKLIIAHLPNDAFEAVRTELIDLGVLRVTVSQVHSASPQSAITLRYRAPLQSHLRPELRLECVATDGRSSAVINVLRGHAGSAGQVAVLDLEELHPPSSVEQASSENPRLDAAVLVAAARGGRFAQPAVST